MSGSSVRAPHLMIVIHSLAGGGAERVAADLSLQWVERGYRVSVVTQADASGDAYTLDPRVKRFVLGTAGVTGGGAAGALANLRRIWKLRRLMRRERPHQVVGMMTTSSILAVLAARGLPVRVIATEHTHPPAQNLSPMWLRLRRWAYPKAKRVVALTSGTAAWIKEHIPGSKVSVIPNAVRWPLPEVEPVIDPPARYGRKRLLAVGRLHPVKGFDLLIAAFRLLESYHPDWDLVILGEGEARDALQQQIEGAGLTHRISMPGRVGNIGQWYAESDMYVLSSRTEGLSNTLLESMASGLPAVAFDCETGPREVVRPAIDGALVQPAEDIEALAAHLSDMMGNEIKRRSCARRAVDVLDRFSNARIMVLWDEVLRAR